eukprot:gene8077-biopygen21120
MDLVIWASPFEYSQNAEKVIFACILTPPSKSGFIPVQLSPVSFPLSPTQSGLIPAQSSSVRLSPAHSRHIPVQSS